MSRVKESVALLLSLSGTTDSKSLAFQVSCIPSLLHSKSLAFQLSCIPSLFAYLDVLSQISRCLVSNLTMPCLKSHDALSQISRCLVSNLFQVSCKSLKRPARDLRQDIKICQETWNAREYKYHILMSCLSSHSQKRGERSLERGRARSIKTNRSIGWLRLVGSLE